MANEKNNYERLIALANSVFETKNDPHQLDVNEEVMERLAAIHPSCLSEFEEGDGPLSWVLVFPTSNILRDRFLKNEITEKELFYLTEIGIKYDATIKVKRKFGLLNNSCIYILLSNYVLLFTIYNY